MKYIYLVVLILLVNIVSYLSLRIGNSIIFDLSRQTKTILQ